MKKIMFDDHYGLERAVLEGRKTMTRRIVPEKLQATFDACSKGVLVIPVSAIPEDLSIEEFAEQWCKQQGKPRLVTVKDEPDIQYIDGPVMVMEHSRYQKGDEVAIAQRYFDIALDTLDSNCDKEKYKAFKRAVESDNLHEQSGWGNKMFVRADLMPHRIRITDIKVERLCDISPDDAMREGISSHTDDKGTWYEVKGTTIVRYDPVEAFAELINKISGKGTWDKNPWVFAYTFELVI